MLGILTDGEWVANDEQRGWLRAGPTVETPTGASNSKDTGAQ